MKGLPTFDSSSDGHESGIAVPSEGAGNIALYERSRDPGLPGERGYIEPRWEDILWDIEWEMVQIIKGVSEKGETLFALERASRRVGARFWPKLETWCLVTPLSAWNTWLAPNWPIGAVTESRHALGSGKERLWIGASSYTKLYEGNMNLGL